MKDEAVEAINHVSVLLEQQNAKLEGINSLPTRIDFHRLEGKVDDVSQRLVVVEAALRM